jgi:hypothetical protein
MTKIVKINSIIKHKNFLQKIIFRKIPPILQGKYGGKSSKPKNGCNLDAKGGQKKRTACQK